MANAPAGAVDAFEFMLVRSARSVERSKRRREYIRDETLYKGGIMDSDLFSESSSSAIGKLVYNRVFCPPSGSSSLPDAARQSLLWQEVLQGLTGILPTCPYQGAGKALEAIGERNYLYAFNKYFVIPDRLSDVNDGLCRKLPAVLALLHQPPLRQGDTLDMLELRKRLQTLFDGVPLHDVAFDRAAAARTLAFATARRKLFDALYVLYVLRRFVRVDLEEIIGALAAVHTLEALAADEFIERLAVGTAPAGQDFVLFEAMRNLFPELAGWGFTTPPPAPFPLVSDLQSLRVHLEASPVVHPIFARLHGFRRSSTSVRPIGIGDLKVVKHWLCKYAAGEIAHIENVLEGEQKTRVHRRLEKSEDSSTFLSERQDESQRDTQSTDRFELKREAEQAIKSDLSLNANASLTYRGTAITVTAGAGMSYARSQNDQIKAAANYSREVLDKAVKRVQSRVSEQRTSTRLFETEETNTHGLKNPAGKGHISGIYRWLDKVYRAQLFNYGKRMMFEFVLPEPAAFLVESRLRAFEAGLDVPQVPPSPAAMQVTMPVTTPAEIDREMFQELSRTYDLSAFEYPAETRRITFLDPETNQALLQRRDLPNDEWSAATYRADLNVRNYRLINVTVDGYVHFNGKAVDEPNAEARQINAMAFFVNGVELHTYENNDAISWRPKNYVLGHAPLPILEDETSLVIGVQDGSFYNLTVRGELSILPDVLLDWKSRVYNAIWKIEREKTASAQARLQQEYESRMSVYRNRLEQIRAVALNDLLQGQSPAMNRDMIVTELKRQCIAMLSREFDAESHDDLVGSINAMGERSVEISYRRLRVTETPATGAPTSVSVGFQNEPHTVSYPLLDIEASMSKGRYVQFLEQAFEWNQLAYIFYPYFWAKDTRWVEMMNRQDGADPAWTAFLRAGSVKVLLAVTPAYDSSVLHYIATGTPLEGGPAPVIGDPLYVPLYEELRRQQDDLAGATAEGEPWTFTVPTSLVYLENSSTPLPKSACAGVP